ncbi:CotH kinase family protein [Paludisphaera borealis]|uniref:Inner spore coat protein H n=1 Tax=Paludisphaera borealis TaxID=1387353 RepID=A0A1U7CTP7_9BACT|nr:CotH kinase family protein [Paludisphaera borealis]APW62314.1 Inner spore coat protein H [Paludisphaera borealis]
MPRTTLGIFLLVIAGVLIGLAAIGVIDDPGAFEASPALAQGPPPGPGGPPGFGGPGFGPGMFLAPTVVKEADADEDGKLSPEEAGKAAEKFIRDADKDKKGSIDADALGRAVNRRMPPPPPGFGPEEPSDEFGPGTFMAPGIVEAADANKDGRLSPEEAAKAAEKFVRDADADKKGGLDADALAKAMSQRMGPPPGFGGPGGPGGKEKKLVKAFDKDGDGRLNLAERVAARESLKKDKAAGGGRRGFGPPPGFGGGKEEPVKPGPRIAPGDVATYSGKPLYDPTIVRTLFLDFDDKGWEGEMADFYKSDVEIPATLTVDGRKLPGVGVHFRGMSSFFTVKEGHKRSLNVSLDFVNPDQKLDGYKTLNLLNAHEDSSFLHTILYSEIARNYLPTPKANFVRVVIDGESWGLYTNVQQFDKQFLAENFGTDKGARWKVPGNPGADGGLRYLGDDLKEYESRFELKSPSVKGKGKDDWKALIDLCRTLNQTPPDKLEAALGPILDVDGVLWFLAVENVLVNGDGYWTRASDYSIYRDPKGKFHVVPHDMNETFQPAMMFGPPGGPGGRGGRGGRPGGGPGGPGFGPGGPGGGPGGRPGGPGGMGAAGVDLDPLVGLDNERTPLRSKLLAVPALKARYLSHVKTIAETWLDWKTLGPIVERYRALIEKEIEADTRKLSSLAAFQKSVAEADEPAPAPGAGPGRGRRELSLKAFADGRRRALLDNAEIKKAKADEPK